MLPREDPARDLTTLHVSLSGHPGRCLMLAGDIDATVEIAFPDPTWGSAARTGRLVGLALALCVPLVIVLYVFGAWRGLKPTPHTGAMGAAVVSVLAAIGWLIWRKIDPGELRAQLSAMTRNGTRVTTIRQAAESQLTRFKLTADGIRAIVRRTPSGFDATDVATNTLIARATVERGGSRDGVARMGDLLAREATILGKLGRLVIPGDEEFRAHAWLVDGQTSVTMTGGDPSPRLRMRTDLSAAPFSWIPVLLVMLAYVLRAHDAAEF